MPAAKKAPVEEVEPTGHDVVPEAEVSEEHVEFITTANTAAGVDADGQAVDHVTDTFDHVVEVHN